MAVYEVRHAPRCKFCKHPKITEINAVCERRAKKDITPEAWEAEMVALGVENAASGDGWKGHWGPKKHYYMKSDAAVAADNKVAEEALAELEKGDIQLEDLDAGIQFLITVYLRQQKQRFLRGEDLHLTHDHFIKLSDAATKRKHNEQQNQLLHALTGGIAGAFAKALNPPEERPALDAGVVDVEPIAEDDGE